MNEFLGFQFLGSFKLLMDAEQLIVDASKQRGETAPLTAIERGVVRATLDAAAKECARIGLDGAVNRIYGARLLVYRSGGACDLLVIRAEIKLVIELTMHDLSKQKFAHVAPAYIPFFEADALFGKEVEDAFPLARRDIKDAGNAVAAELPTAAVFHAMRVAERGLRTLADKLGVEIQHPLDFVDWDRIFNAVVKKLDALNQAKKTAKQEAQLRNYADALVQARYFREAWLIHVSHGATKFLADRPIEPEDARRVVERVRRFMQDLAKLKIAEKPKPKAKPRPIR